MRTTKPVSYRPAFTREGSARLERLESLRGAASFYVFLHHWVRHDLPEAPGLARFFVFGQAAVLVFFLLSGFVIHYATLRRNPDISFRVYFIRRFRRIYPTFVLALVTAYLCASAIRGAFLNPSWGDLGINLLMLQDRAREGNWALMYMHNTPLWSLAYEWWFYMFYFAVRAVARRPGLRGQGSWGVHRALVLALSLSGWATDVLWPNPISHIASYFVLWWIGVELAHEFLARGSVSVRGQAPMLAAAVAVAGLWGLTAVLGAQGAIDWYTHPGLTFRHFATTLVVLGAGWVWYRCGLVGYDRLLGPFGRIAPFSYALYVMHMPIVMLVAKLRVTPYGLLDLLWLTPLLFAVCWLIEQPLQRHINRRLPAPHRSRRTFVRAAPG